MVESVRKNFPFHKISGKYLFVEVMMFVDHIAVKNFMFYLTKETRSFLKFKFIIIENGFINNGLITHYLGYGLKFF